MKPDQMIAAWKDRSMWLDPIREREPFPLAAFMVRIDNRFENVPGALRDRDTLRRGPLEDFRMIFPLVVELFYARQKAPRSELYRVGRTSPIQRIRPIGERRANVIREVRMVVQNLRDLTFNPGMSFLLPLMNCDLNLTHYEPIVQEIVAAKIPGLHLLLVDHPFSTQQSFPILFDNLNEGMERGVVHCLSQNEAIKVKTALDVHGGFR